MSDPILARFDEAKQAGNPPVAKVLVDSDGQVTTVIVRVGDTAYYFSGDVKRYDERSSNRTKWVIPYDGYERSVGPQFTEEMMQGIEAQFAKYREQFPNLDDASIAKMAFGRLVPSD